MIPNILISKYLDSELSLEEDVEFRAMLAADPQAREAFDSAVLLHIAMRCEDDTTVPADVEERVFAFIDAIPAYAQRASTYAHGALAYEHHASIAPQNSATNSSAPQSSLKGLGARGGAKRRFMAVAAMLLVLVLPFGDQFLRLDNGLSQSTTQNTTLNATQNTTLNTTRTTTPTSTFLASTSGTVPASGTQVGASVGSSLAAEPVVGNGGSDNQRANADGGSDNQRANADVASVDVPQDQPLTLPSLHSLFASNDMPPFVDNNGAESGSTHLTPDAPTVDVLVSTSFSQSFASPTTGAVTTVAAGIGYAVASSTFVGMEMGSTQYTRTNATSGLVTDHSSGTFADMQGNDSKQRDQSGQLAKVTVESNTSPRYRTEVHTSLSPEGTIWGAAFVQHSVLKTGILALNGRLGAGVGQDGMLTYGRMQAECALFSGVSLTIGAEARYSPFRTGVSGGQPMARTYGTVISAAYGLQVRL